MEDAKSSPPLPLSSVTIISRSSVYPDQPSTLARLNLSVFDIPLLFFHHGQMGLLFQRPINLPSSEFLNHLRSSLSRALSFYPPLAGRLVTDPDGSFFVACNDAGVDFVHAVAPGLSSADVEVRDSDVPDVVKELFLLNGVVNLVGCSSPLVAVQVTELADGVFLSCSINHAVADGISSLNFMVAWSELCRGIEKISRSPDFNRHLLKGPLILVPRPPVGSTHPSSVIRDRVFHFSPEAIQHLKAKANSSLASTDVGEISSFQSLCAQLWRSVTRARRLGPEVETSLGLATNCRNRMEPPLGTHYFGNAVLPVFTVAKADEVLGREVGWCAQLLHSNLVAFGDGAVRREMETWKEQNDPSTLGNSGAPRLMVAWSPRFPAYEIDMGWGRPVAVYSGTADKFDGVVLAFPGRQGGGGIDLEVCLEPETLARLESDEEFMHYVAGVSSLAREGYKEPKSSPNPTPAASSPSPTPSSPTCPAAPSSLVHIINGKLARDPPSNSL